MKLANKQRLAELVQRESGWNPTAVSTKGAQGLAQLMPGTAARFNVGDIWDPAENIRGGATYLRLLLDMFDNDLRLALADLDVALKDAFNEVFSA